MRQVRIRGWLVQIQGEFVRYRINGGRVVERERERERGREGERGGGGVGVGMAMGTRNPSTRRVLPDKKAGME